MVYQDLLGRIYKKGKTGQGIWNPGSGNGERSFAAN